VSIRPVKKKKARKEEIEKVMSPAEAKKFQRYINDALDQYGDESAKRGEWADRTIQKQDAPTRIAIELMTDKMHDMARVGGANVLTVSVPGYSDPAKVPLSNTTVDNNLKYFTVRLFTEALEWGIQIANFKVVKK
jgi:hypothetical protein